MGKHKNSMQDEILLRFMEDHKQIAKGFVKGDKVAIEELWKGLAEDLNSYGPPQKDVQGWKKVWIDWKAIVRKKIAHNNSEGRATGGGSFNKHVLTAAEDTIGRLCGIYKVVRGIDNTREFGQPCNDENAVNVSNLENDAEIPFATDFEFSAAPADCEFSAADDLLPTTSTTAATPKRRREPTWNDSIKKYMAEQTQAMLSTAQQLKEIKEDKENVRAIKDIKLYMKDVNRTLKNINETLSNTSEENKRHHFKMEKLREEELYLKKKELELQEAKLNLKRNMN